MAGAGRLKYTRGGPGVVWSVFGLAFIWVTLTHPATHPGDDLANKGFLVLGVVLVLLGLCRYNLVVDPSTRTVRSFYSLVVPLFGNTHSWEAFREVQLARAWREHRWRRRYRTTETFQVYEARLWGEDGYLLLAVARDVHRVRGPAKDVARTMGLPLRDSSGGRSEVRSPERLDESVGDRLRREGLELEAPRPPDGLVPAVRFGEGSVTFERPPRGFGADFWVVQVNWLLVAAIAVGFVALSRALSGDQAVAVPFALIGLLVGLGPLWQGLFTRTYREWLTVEEGGVKLTRSWPGMSVEQAIPGSELEEVGLWRARRGHAGEQALELVGGRNRLLFGKGLPLAELHWIRKTIQFVMARGGQRSPQPARPAPSEPPGAGPAGG